jgi:hypothetical protein
MAETEKRKKIKQNIDDKLSSIYKTTTINGGIFFVANNGIPFRIDTIAPPTDAIVVEYGDTWEDGDCFYVNELSEEEIYFGIFQEVDDADR